MSQALRYHGQSFHNTSKKTRGVLGLEQKNHWLSRSGLKEKLLCQASWVVSVVWPPSNPKNQNLPWSWFYSCLFFQVETNPFQEVSIEISRETGRGKKKKSGLSKREALAPTTEDQKQWDLTFIHEGNWWTKSTIRCRTKFVQAYHKKRPPPQQVLKSGFTFKIQPKDRFSPGE